MLQIIQNKYKVKTSKISVAYFKYSWSNKYLPWFRKWYLVGPALYLMTLYVLFNVLLLTLQCICYAASSTSCKFTYTRLKNRGVSLVSHSWLHCAIYSSGQWKAIHCNWNLSAVFMLIWYIINHVNLLHPIIPVTGTNEICWRTSSLLLPLEKDRETWYFF